MPELTLDFDIVINDSVQVGDTAYYCTQTSGQFNNDFNIQTGDINELGVITKITTNDNLTDRNRLVIRVPGWVANTMPSTNSFILFSKDNLVNTSTPIGYYAKAKFINNSLIKSEMFSTSCDIFESSK